MFVTNLTKWLTEIGLADFLRETAKKNSLVLNEEARSGTEWQMGARTGQGIEMIAISITKDDTAGLTSLNLEEFFVDENGERKKKAIMGTAYHHSVMISGTTCSRRVILYKRRLLTIDGNKLFRTFVEGVANAIVPTEKLSRESGGKINEIIDQAVLNNPSNTVDKIFQTITPEIKKILDKEDLVALPSFAGFVKMRIRDRLSEYRLARKLTNKVSL